MTVRKRSIVEVSCNNCHTIRDIDAVWLGLLDLDGKFYKDVTLCSDNCLESYKRIFLDSAEIGTLLIEEWAYSI